MKRRPIANEQELLNAIQPNRTQILSLGVRRLGIFGSFARNEQNQASDVDILVEFQPHEKTFDNFMRLAFLLEELFGRKVELVTPESLSPFIAPYIIGEVKYAITC